MLYYLFFKKESKRNFYFNNLIEELSPHKKQLSDYSELAKYCYKWNDIAKERNKISHEMASLTKDISMEVEYSDIVNQHGQRIVKFVGRRKTKEDYFVEIQEHLNSIINLNNIIRDLIVKNKDNIFRFNTLFPWKNYSIKKTPTTKKIKKYLVYKLGGYYILTKDEINNSELIEVPENHIFWKELDYPPH